MKAQVGMLVLPEGEHRYKRIAEITDNDVTLEYSSALKPDAYMRVKMHRSYLRRCKAYEPVGGGIE